MIETLTSPARRLPAGILLALLLVTAPLHAQEGTGPQRYISDDITVTLRDAPRNNAPSTGSVRSGTRVTVLENLGPESFARIRTADGRSGWISARYLSAQPAAKDRYGETREALTAAQSESRALQSQLAEAQRRLEQARPAFELQQENGRLRQQLEEQERNSATLQLRYDQARQQRKTLVTGAGLVGTGTLLGLLLPWLLRHSGRRRRYNEF
ncbi:MAG TPA: TIGR04211 family SH3 domain-containing protein [Solimonas sp.]|nr:TIGR04211 family SH3 domain-containing protein [Solimonas sp.]